MGPRSACSDRQHALLPILRVFILGELKMQDVADLPEKHVRRLAFIREEMRFEIGVFHDRINALISTEAFLLISFTMALVYSNAHWSDKFFLVAPMLSVIGFTLAVLAWPGINTSYKILVEWNVLLVQVLNEAHGVSDLMWRPSLFAGGDRRTQADHRNGMLFARSVPVVFAAAWVILAVVVLTAPWR
jgi:hypothetical protein